MSQYTTELRYLVEQGYDIGLTDYPLFDETYRDVLNKKIVDEYFFREIGQETPSRFKHYLNHTMNMIMPYYNQLYQSQLLEIDPLVTYRDEETMHRTIDTDNSENRTGTENVKKDITSTGSEDQTILKSETDTVVKTGTETTGATNTGTNVTATVAHGTADTIGTETTDEDTTNTRTENKFGVHSATPGGMISVGDIKTHTWADDAKIDEGTIGDVGTNDRTVTVDNTVTQDSDTTATNTVDLAFDNTLTLNRTDAGTVTADNSINKALSEDIDETVSGSTTDVRTGTVDTVDEYLKKKFGFTGNQSRLLTEYRKTFLNIDAMIVKELNVLFMGIY